MFGMLSQFFQSALCFRLQVLDVKRGYFTLHILATQLHFKQCEWLLDFLLGLALANDLPRGSGAGSSRWFPREIRLEPEGLFSPFFRY